MEEIESNWLDRLCKKLWRENLDEYWNEEIAALERAKGIRIEMNDEKENAKLVAYLVDLAVSHGCIIEMYGIKVTPVPQLQKREGKHERQMMDRPAPERKPQRQPGHHPIQDLQGLGHG